MAISKRVLQGATAAVALAAIAGLGRWMVKPAAAVQAADAGVAAKLANLHWRMIGPYSGGRVLAVTGIPGDGKVFYFGAVDGGVWKTENAGASWTPLFDAEPVQSIGAIGVAPSDPNIIYVGTGEGAIRNDISFGDGMYKSTDAGKTWTHIGLDDSQHIARLQVDPKDPNRVYVAALGHASGPNSMRGIYRTLDGGQTWQRVLYKDDQTGGVDISIDPNDNQIVYAALYQTIRRPWGADSGGPGSGLYKSVDGGTTWKQLTGNGLPPGVLGKIGVAVGANSSRVYALIEAKQGGLYVSDDAGASWKLVNDSDEYRQRAWYFTNVFADPKTPDTVYVEDTGLFRSTDGGKTFTSIHGGDSHGLWIDPQNPEHLFHSSDGGASISLDGGRTWSPTNNEPTAQFYHVDTDSDFDYHLYGEKQDSGSVVIASRTGRGSIGQADEYGAAGGESGWLVPKPGDSNIVYGQSYDGDMTRYDKAQGSSTNISPWPLNPMGHGAADLKYRFQWTAPIATSTFDPNVVYFGGNVLFKSTDEGNTWKVISPDLTRNDKSKQVSSGGPITQDNTSAEYYDTIFEITEQPKQKGVIWVGSDDGLVHVTLDDGAHWSDVTPPELKQPKYQWAKIGMIAPSPFDAGTAYVAARRNKMDDFEPLAYKTTDFGKTWTKIVTGIPSNEYVQAVRPDTVHKGLLFAGTELGVYVSYNDGGSWEPLQLNLPHASVRDLVVHGDDLLIATHGRAFWSLDDITPIREWSDAASSGPAFLFKPEVAYLTHGGGGGGGRGFGGGAGETSPNPPGPIVIDYMLNQPADGPVTISFSDASGKVLKQFSSATAQGARGGGGGAGRGGRGGRGGGANAFAAVTTHPGFNRFAGWDMRLEAPQAVPGEAHWGGGQGSALMVPPGMYTVKLTVNGQSYTAPLRITMDPHLHVTDADMQKQYELAEKLWADLNNAHVAVNDMLSLQKQIAALKQSNPTAVGAEGEALNQKLHDLEYKLAQLDNKSSEDALNYPIMLDDQVGNLLNTVEGTDSAPTPAMLAVYDYLQPQLEAQMTAWNNLKTGDLAAFNAQLRRNNLEAIAPGPQPAPEAGRGGRGGE